MIPTYSEPYGADADLRIGWASWDKDPATGRMRYEHRSIKFAYQKDGKISRGAPELPFGVLLDMVKLAAERGELNDYPDQVKRAYEKLGDILTKK